MNQIVTTLLLRFTGNAKAAIEGSKMATTFNSSDKLRVPIAGERLRLFTAKGPVLFEVVEREFHFMNERTTVRLVLDIAPQH